MTNPHLTPLALQEITSYAGFTHICPITADNLTMATNATAQTIQLSPLPIGTYVYKVEFRLVRPFKNSADAAFNTTTASMGDTSGVASMITAKELNANGAFITVPALMNTPTGPYAALDALNITFNAMAAKKLLDINIGELHILAQLFIPKSLSDVKRESAISK